MKGQRWNYMMEAIRTRLLSGYVGCVETFFSVTSVRCELEPQRRSTGAVGGARQIPTQGRQHIAWIGGAIVNFQNIVIFHRVEFIKCNQYAIVTGYCDTPGTSLLVWVVDWIVRAGEVPRMTSILITWTIVCKASKEQHIRTLSYKNTKPLSTHVYKARSMWDHAYWKETGRVWGRNAICFEVVSRVTNPNSVYTFMKYYVVHEQWIPHLVFVEEVGCEWFWNLSSTHAGGCTNFSGMR